MTLTITNNADATIKVGANPDDTPTLITEEEFNAHIEKGFNKNLTNPKIGKLKKGYPVEVKSAGIKGNGVFATRDIKRGEILCFYDGIVCSDLTVGTLMSGSHGYNQSYGEASTYRELRTVGRSIAGFPECLRDGGCAQLCNDASTTYTDEKDLKYLKNINVKEVYSGNTFVFCASKRIKKGQEILYSYGPQYWAGKKRRQEEAGQVDGSDPQEFPKLFASIATDPSQEHLVKKYAESFEQEGWSKYTTRFVCMWLLRASQQ